MNVQESVAKAEALLAKGATLFRLDGCELTAYDLRVLLARAAESTLGELEEAAKALCDARNSRTYKVELLTDGSGRVLLNGMLAVGWLTLADAIPAIRAATEAERAKRKPKEPTPLEALDSLEAMASWDGGTAGDERSQLVAIVRAALAQAGGEESINAQ